MILCETETAGFSWAWLLELPFATGDSTGAFFGAVVCNGSELTTESFPAAGEFTAVELEEDCSSENCTPQNSVMGSVNSSSTYPLTLR